MISFWPRCSNGRVIWKESNDEIRYRMMNNLNVSASCYADHAENKVSRLQQAYLRKYQPQKYAYSANVSQRPQDDQYDRFGSMRSASFSLPASCWQGFESASAAPSEGGIADVTHAFQLGY